MSKPYRVVHQIILLLRTGAVDVRAGQPTDSPDYRLVRTATTAHRSKLIIYETSKRIPRRALGIKRESRNRPTLRRITGSDGRSIIDLTVFLYVPDTPLRVFMLWRILLTWYRTSSPRNCSQ